MYELFHRFYRYKFVGEIHLDNGCTRTTSAGKYPMNGMQRWLRAMSQSSVSWKSVLVTSHTKKALSVLKEKVAPGLQDLCVSMLDDSNVDMERSVDGITSYTY